MQRVFLIHGWSVTETTTYQALHLKLAKQGFDLRNICLGRYVSLDDDVCIRDIARALHYALLDELKEESGNFHIITHSTGALVARYWIANHYDDKFASKHALKNLLMLAGPHHGSRLAHHGRTMLAYIKYGSDTGRKLLEALELGSEFNWQLTADWLNGTLWRKRGIRPYCLIGDRQDLHLRWDRRGGR